MMIKVSLTASLALISMMGCRSGNSENTEVKDVLVSNTSSTTGYDILYFKKDFVCLATCIETYKGEFFSKIVGGSGNVSKSNAVRSMCSGQAKELAKSELESWFGRQIAKNADATSIALVRDAMVSNAGIKIANLNPNRNTPAIQFNYSRLIGNLYDYMRQSAPPSTGECGPVNDGVFAPQNVPAVTVSAIPVSNPPMVSNPGTPNESEYQTVPTGPAVIALKSGVYKNNLATDQDVTCLGYVKAFHDGSGFQFGENCAGVLPPLSDSYSCSPTGMCTVKETGIALDIRLLGPDSFHFVSRTDGLVDLIWTWAKDLPDNMPSGWTQ